MRIVVPTTRTYPEVYGALSDTDWPYDVIPVEHSDRAYYDLLAALWAAGESFAIVEHDVVVHPSAPLELASCPSDWCGFPYDYCGLVTYGLGCVKFSEALIARHPDAMLRVGVMSDDRHPKRHWCRLDAWLTCVLESVGEERHRHRTFVRHLGTGCAHGCIPGLAAPTK